MHKKIKMKNIALLPLIIISLVLSGCGTDGLTGDEPRVINLSTTVADTSTLTMSAVRFGEILEKKTDGRYEIRVYPNEQLSGGNSSKAVELLSSGAIEMTVNSNIIYSVLDNRFDVLSLPFLFENYDQAFETLEGEGGEAIREVLLEKNIIGLGYFANGFRQLTTNKPIYGPEDVQGLRLRVPGMNMYVSWFSHIGADPLAMNFSEVFTSLQQGTIDGQENPLDLIDTSKIYEVQDYVTNWNYSFDAMILGINKSVWDDLPAEDQVLFQEAADEAVAFQHELLLTNEAALVEKFTESGTVVTPTEDVDLNGFKALTDQMMPQFEETYGKDFIDKFR